MKRPKQGIALLLCLLMIVTSAMPAFAMDAKFTDIEGHWAKGRIQSAADSGLIKGYIDGSFRPNNTISRVEFFALVNRGYKFTQKKSITYGDIQEDAWYVNEIEKATAAGYIDLEAGGMVEPDRPITREEAAAIIAKVEKLYAVSLEPVFNDDAQADEMNKNAIIAVSEAKIMTGYPNGDFDPKGNIKRAEAIVTISRSMAHESKENFVYYEEKTYGNDSSKTIVDGNVIVTKSGATLKNLVINGHLTIGSQVGEGEVYLEDVEVKGATLVYGGGVNSIYLNNVKMNAVYVDKALNSVRLVASGNTDIKDVVARSKVELREKNLTTNAKGFDKLLVEEQVLGDKKVIVTVLSGTLSTVDIKGKNVDLITSTSARITKLTVDGESTRILGRGIITSASVNANAVTFDQQPRDLNVSTGFNKPMIKTPTATTSSGGSSGGGSSSGGSSSGGSSGGGGTTPSPVVIDTPAELADAIASSGSTVTLGGNISGDVTAKRTNSGALIINFSGYSINGDLEITADNASAITLNSSASEEISGDFTVDAKNASVTNNVSVGGKAVLKNVAYNSYDANKPHGRGIDVKGRAKVVIAPTVTNVIINIQSIFPIVLQGTVSEVNVEAEGASAIVQGTVKKVNIKKGAKDAKIQLTASAQVTSMKMDEPVTVLAENINTVVINIDTTGEVQQVIKKVAHLVHFNENGGDTVPSPSFIYIENGEDLGMLPSTPIRNGYVFTEWNTEATGNSGQSVTESTTVNSAATYYARWNEVVADTYTVSFESNGGTFVAPQAGLASGGNTTLSTTPTRTDGYTFAGWYTDDATFTTEFTGATPVTADITVYAKWVKSTYSVYFDANGGSDLANGSVTAGQMLTLPTAPTRAGYTFAGWHTSIDLVDVFVESTSIHKDMTLYAKWTVDSPTTYTVTFETNGGSEIVAKEIPENAIIVLPSSPSRVNYEFVGWYTDAGLTTAFVKGAVIAGDTTLYAKWVQGSYKISFDANGGSLVSPIKVTAGGTVVMPTTDPTKLGYSFGGWFMDSKFETPFTSQTVVAQDLLLLAKWTAATYIISFDTVGGNSISPMQVTAGQAITLPTPVRGSDVFTGWYLKGDLIDASTPITSDITLSAGWDHPTTTTYTVSFDTRGGTPTTIAPITVTPGSLITNMPSDPTRGTDTFSGWYLDAGYQKKFDKGTPIMGDMTLHAGWNITPPATTYTVSFDANGGSMVMPIANITPGATIVLPPDPSKTGYIFDGWYKDNVTFNNEFFGKNDAPLETPTPVNENIMLYADWIVKSPSYYTVMFDENGGSTVSDISNVTSGATVVLPTTTKAGTAFRGWFETELYLTEFTGVSTVNKNLELHACFTTSSATFVATFKDGDATVAVETTTGGGSVVAIPADPAPKVDFTFDGWFAGNPATQTEEKVTTLTKIYTDLIIHARWIPKGN